MRPFHENYVLDHIIAQIQSLARANCKSDNKERIRVMHLVLPHPVQLLFSALLDLLVHLALPSKQLDHS